MKKILLLSFAFLSLTWFTQAQVVFSESFEGIGLPTGWTLIDNDGDHLNWEVLDLTSHDGTQCASSESYHKAPDGHGGTPLTPDNWLTTPAITLSENAANATLTFWVIGQNPNACNEHFSILISNDNNYFLPVYNGTATNEYVKHTVNLNTYIGQTFYISFRHHNSTNQSRLNLDEVKVKEIPSLPTIDVATDIDFNEIILNEPKTIITDIEAYNLTEAISVNTSNPFLVSADGITFASTTTISATGGNLYIQYNPTAVGTHTGTITLNSTNITKTINLSGSAIVCEIISTFPFIENFDDGMPLCWQNFNPNDETAGWKSTYTPTTIQTGTGAAKSTTVDDWLIISEIALTHPTTLTFYVRSGQGNQPDNYEVLVSTTGIEITDFTPIHQANAPGNYEQVRFNLSAYIGDTIHLAFRHSAGLYGLYLDEIHLDEITTPTLYLSTESLDFETIPAGTSVVKKINVDAYALTEVLTATATNPYSISAEGINYSGTANLPATGGILYVKYNPTSIGTNTINIVLTSSNLTDTVSVTGTAIECDIISTFPYHESFDEGIPVCWLNVDADGDGFSWEHKDYSSAYEGEGCAASNSYLYAVGGLTPDNWLISPVIIIQNSAALTYYAQSNTTAPEAYGVYISNSGTDLNDFTEIHHAIAPYSYDLVSLNLNDYIGDTIHIAFRHYGDTNRLRLLIDEVDVHTYTEPTIEISQDTIDFGTFILGNNIPIKQVTVDAYALATGEHVTATTTAPFEVSADGIIFGTTATLSNFGGTLFVRYNPSTEGTNAAIVILSATNATNMTISLSGNSLDCSDHITLPYEQDFEDGMPFCYNIENADNDELSWIINELPDLTHSGNIMAVSLSGANYGVTSLDNWMILPAFTVGNNHTELTFWAGGLESIETYEVLVSTNGNAIENFNSILNVTTSEEEGYVRQIVDLSNYAGQSINIAFRHYGIHTPANALRLEDISIKEYVDGEIETVDEFLNFNGVLNGSDATLTTVLYGHYLTTDITATTAAPFSLSTNGITYNNSVTIPAAGGNLYVKYTPPTIETHTGTITLTSGQTTATINVSGFCYECNPITEFPLEEDFEDNFLPYCWSLIDADGDGYNWDPTFLYGDANATHSGNGMIASASFINYHGQVFPDNWLISPAIQTTNKDLELDYWISTQDPDYPNEHYGVYVSTTGTNSEDFTSVYENVNPLFWTNEHITFGPEYHNKTIYIAFRHHDSSDQYWIKLDDVTINEVEGTNVEGYSEVHVNIYPNPAQNLFNVSANSNIESIAIFDLAGEQVGYYNGNGYTKQINVSNLANGMYFLKIETANGMISKKVNVVK